MWQLWKGRLLEWLHLNAFPSTIGPMIQWMVTDFQIPAQAYAFENLSLDLKLVRTNFPPRTIVRGPGFINSVMIIEQVCLLPCKTPINPLDLTMEPFLFFSVASA